MRHVGLWFLKWDGLGFLNELWQDYDSLISKTAKSVKKDMDSDFSSYGHHMWDLGKWNGISQKEERDRYQETDTNRIERNRKADGLQKKSFTYR